MIVSVRLKTALPMILIILLSFISFSLVCFFFFFFLLLEKSSCSLCGRHLDLLLSDIWLNSKLLFFFFFYHFSVSVHPDCINQYSSIMETKSLVVRVQTVFWFVWLESHSNVADMNVSGSLLPVTCTYKFYINIENWMVSFYTLSFLSWVYISASTQRCIKAKLSQKCNLGPFCECQIFI